MQIFKLKTKDKKKKLIFAFIIFLKNKGFIQHNKKNTRCFACNKQTLGIFHQAKEIIKKMEGVKTEKDPKIVNDSDDD
jgi:hypothetical protein